MIYMMIHVVLWTRCWGFTPSLASVLRQSMRQRRLGYERDSTMKGQDEAGRALEQAAKLRREIAELELDLRKGDTLGCFLP